MIAVIAVIPHLVGPVLSEMSLLPLDHLYAEMLLCLFLFVPEKMLILAIPYQKVPVVCLPARGLEEVQNHQVRELHLAQTLVLVVLAEILLKKVIVPVV
jgi:hypothetical protein